MNVTFAPSTGVVRVQPHGTPGLVLGKPGGHDSEMMADNSSDELTWPVEVTGAISPLRLQGFQDWHAAVVAGWVTTDDQLKRLAPGTTMPLTPAKVLSWQRPGGRTFVLSRDHSTGPLGYLELNPMARQTAHYWLGHVIIAPPERGKGLGIAFVGSVVRFAFERLLANRISLIVLPDNTQAIACYRHVGFTRVAEEVHHFPPGRAETRMLRYEITMNEFT